MNWIVDEKRLVYAQLAMMASHVDEITRTGIAMTIIYRTHSRNFINHTIE